MSHLNATNGFIERVNGRMGDGFLDEHSLDSLCQADNPVASCSSDFDHQRPHTSHSGLTAAENVNQSKQDQNLNKVNQN